jgi:hypothetical protein
MRTTSPVHRPGHVDHQGGRSHIRTLRLLVMLTAPAALAAGCAARGPGPGAFDVPDPAVEAAAVAQTMPQQRLHVIFTWDMRDRDTRFNGQGVLRLDRGYRARVDLFGPRGETYAAAVVAGEEMRVVPPGVGALLPPPALLWSALGVFRPPADAPLAGTSRADGQLALGYGRDGTVWRFAFQDGLLRNTEWTSPGARRTVALTGSAGYGLPQQAAFRDWTEFRELTLRVTDVEEQIAFDPDVWVLPGGR